MKGKLIIAALSAFLLSGTAFAQECPKGEKCDPPVKERMCTIGWYKNNGFDSWYPACLEADGDAVCDALVDAMYTTGKHAGDAKNAAADTIVANYVGFGSETCEEAE